MSIIKNPVFRVLIAVLLGLAVFVVSGPVASVVTMALPLPSQYRMAVSTALFQLMMALLATLLMLLLSPVIWPWYYIAVIPLAVVRPKPALLVWTVLLPLMYLRPEQFAEPLRSGLIHGPVWALVALAAILALVRGSGGSGAADGVLCSSDERSR